ncbi:hypothetical protein HanIR_Chr09g0422981 [Helianthus annuus]|nr:hypothetical protein HanIR_Chr09g0422981 [Helianthus annuus]
MIVRNGKFFNASQYAFFGSHGGSRVFGGGGGGGEKLFTYLVL